jgi:hypothetical protein
MPGKEETTLDTILHLKRKEPFTPFRIVMSGGDRFTIENPDALAVAATQLHYYPSSGMGIHMRLNQVAAVKKPSEKPAA